MASLQGQSCSVCLSPASRSQIAKWFNISSDDAAALAPGEGADPLAAFRSAGLAGGAQPSSGSLGDAKEAPQAAQAVEGPSFDAAVAGAAIPKTAKVKDAVRS